MGAMAMPESGGWGNGMERKKETKEVDEGWSKRCLNNAPEGAFGHSVLCGRQKSSQEEAGSRPRAVACLRPLSCPFS